MKTRLVRPDESSHTPRSHALPSVSGDRHESTLSSPQNSPELKHVLLMFK